MKKTVQIVTIPLDKKDNAPFFKKDDLVLRKVLGGPNLEPMLKFKIIDKNQIALARLQQLLVLSDDEIQEGDKTKSSYLNKVTDIIGEQWVDYKAAPKDVQDDFKKVIASYPQLEGTLPISKETVQAWIDSGTPLEVILKEALRGSMCLDPQGNLLLEFSKKGFYNLFPIEQCGDLNKPSIPTDEEIEKNSKDYAYAMKGQLYTEKGQHPADTAWSLLSRGYTDGYKQALKDLGHE
jgi:hypothetical protein